MSRGLNLTIPDEADEWPHEARVVGIKEANEAQELRQEINSLVGMENDINSQTDALWFSKAQLAQIVLALGGPQEEVR
jgi:hypothetical protein